MKKIYLWSLFLIFISVLIFSCRKDYKNFFDQKDDISSDLEAAKIFHAKGAYLNKTSYAKLMADGSKGVLSNEKTAKTSVFYKLNPLWKDAFEVKAPDGSDLIVVPTPENKMSAKTFEIRRFFIFTKSSGSIVDGKIVEFLGLQYSLKEKMNDIIANYKNSSVLDLTGAIFEYDLNYFRLRAEVIKQGKRTGVTASLYNLPIAETNVSGKVAMGYYDSGIPDGNGCSQAWYCEGQSQPYGITCWNLGYQTPSYCNTNNPNPGSDSGYDSSGSQQGGGGSYGGNTSPPSSNPEDPCGKAKALANSSNFRSDMATLQSDVSKKYETAMVINADNSVATYNNGPGGTDDKIPLSALNNSAGIMHNHEADHDNIVNLSIFSPPDIKAMYDGVSATLQGFKAIYIFSLVTPAGSYILSIKNLSDFQAFGAANFNTTQNFNLFQASFSAYVRTTNTAAQNEAYFQKVLLDNNSGLQLMKNTGTNSNPTWKSVSGSNGTPTYTPCP